MLYVYHGSSCKGPPRGRRGREGNGIFSYKHRSVSRLPWNFCQHSGERAKRTWVATKSNKRLINSLACSYLRTYTDIPLPSSFAVA